jgi:hypothetical protein
LVGEPSRPVEMSGTCNAHDPSGAEVARSIKLTYNRQPIVKASGDIRYWNVLFTLPDIRVRFSELMTAWFSRGYAIQSLSDLYFGTVHSSSMFVEHRFLNVFQALESYDRRTFIPDPEHAEARQERLDRISNAITAEDWKWLKKRLRTPEPSAADRIMRVVDNVHAGWLLKTEDITLAADLRNYYTHFDSKVEARLPPMDRRFRIMHNLAVRLRVMCELVLLNAVGFSTDEVRQRIQTTRRVQRHIVEL